jgi:hypothetical protein
VTTPTPNLREAIAKEIFRVWKDGRYEYHEWEDFDLDLEFQAEFLKDADRIIALILNAKRSAAPARERFCPHGRDLDSGACAECEARPQAQEGRK